MTDIHEAVETACKALREIAAALAPTPYVPKVGDVVHNPCATAKSEYVVTRRAFNDRTYGHPVDSPECGSFSLNMDTLTYLRPATAAERIAAGIDKPITDPSNGGVGPLNARKLGEVTHWDTPPVVAAPEAKRPKWVRYTHSAVAPTLARRVVRWDSSSNPVVQVVENDGVTLFEDRPMTLHPGEWEPCDPPCAAPTPAMPAVDREKVAREMALCWDPLVAWEMHTVADYQAKWLKSADAAIRLLRPDAVEGKA